MRKFIGVVITFALLLTLAPAVFAVGDLTPEQIAALPNPADGTVLISSQSVTEKDGVTKLIEQSPLFGPEYTLGYVGPSGYKAVVYSPTSGYLAGVLEKTVMEFEDGWTEELPEETRGRLTYKWYTTFAEAVNNAMEFLQDDSLPVVYEQDAIVVFINAAGTPEFKCPVFDLVKYAEKDTRKVATGDLTPKLTVECLTESPESAATVDYKLHYELPGYEVGGYVFEEHGSYAYVKGFDEEQKFQCEGNQTVGDVQFSLSGLTKGTYTVVLITDSGRKYTTPLEVNFNGSVEPVRYNGSYNAPVVTVSGNPTEETQAPITVTLTSDIPATWLWDGEVLSSELTKEVSVTLEMNGVHYYSATSEVGQFTEGQVNVTKLVTVDIAGAEPGLSAADARLVQTGVETSGSSSVPMLVIFGVALAVAGAGVVVYKGKKRGA